jgi:hypothetical protein
VLEVQIDAELDRRDTILADDEQTDRDEQVCEEQLVAGKHRALGDAKCE